MHELHSDSHICFNVTLSTLEDLENLNEVYNLKAEDTGCKCTNKCICGLK